MNIRPARMKELDEIMALYDQGRRFMRQSGNANQWINGYPSREMIREDICLGHCYLALEGEEYTAVFWFFDGEDLEPT